MNVLLVSQCNKRALAETRRILDQFAERRGERTWQTPITMDGLATLKKLLRKTARRNTAVACHWIRGKDHSELMWIVGNASRFNSEGAVPTNTTERDILRTESENDWHTGEDIQLLAQLAALLHDLGKASVAFQKKLRGELVEKNLYRHEWVSLRLFLAFIGKDDDATWLQRLATPTDNDDKTWLQAGRYCRDGLDSCEPPFKNLPPLAAAIAWLVVTHHRLPVKPVVDEKGEQQYLGKWSPDFGASALPGLLQGVTHDWNEVRQSKPEEAITPYWTIKQLPIALPKWRESAAKLAVRLQRLLERRKGYSWLDNPYVMHLSRLSLMLADHHYSALPPDAKQRVSSDKNYKVYANTHKDKTLKQPLDEHLLGVAKFTASIVRSFPGFERFLPTLARHKGLKRRSKLERFRWQDRAADAAVAARDKAAEQGCFIVNMASTGCGKTLANARILNALADPELGLRASFALGLRTLTLQTGRSYRQDLHLNDDELAIKVGGSASRELFEYYESLAESTGSASVQDLMEEDGHVLYEGQHLDHPLLSKVMADPRISALVSAPTLVCTIDHLMPATEAQRAGRQMAPMLRLMSSDLVLDELDDFGMEDLPALTRLVHWGGLLGSRVLLSSATMPPALVEGMFRAYAAGRVHYLKNRGEHGGQDKSNPAVPCLWVDESVSPKLVSSTTTDFAAYHQQFVAQRVKKLQGAVTSKGANRKGEILSLDLPSVENADKADIHKDFAKPVLNAIINAHDNNHETCPHSGKKVSFGLVRMANIEPLFRVAQELYKNGAPEGYQIHLCVYHARFPLLLRSQIEYLLDGVLNRRDSGAVYEREDTRELLSSSEQPNQLFVVLGSPVTEVGRDHDYDWAVVEPSSMRSLIQLAGRVQRHRQKIPEQANIYLFDTNLRYFTERQERNGKPKLVYVKPGFEDKYSKKFRLSNHRLTHLLRESEYRHITACPRIVRDEAPLNSSNSLVDLEHARLEALMLPPTASEQPKRRGSRQGQQQELTATECWRDPQAGLTWVLPQQQPFRKQTGKEMTLVFLPDEDETCLLPHRIHEEGGRGKPHIYVSASHMVATLEWADIPMGQGISPWGRFDLLALLKEQAEAQGVSLEQCAKKFTTVNVMVGSKGSARQWWYHPALGLGEKK
ncbi:type I-F CRISPR-associated helicase Cas3f [Gilvimarinus algae]|uniref:Type I-F CRISPR-associated helicase Cas3f n=1 Tax=Gilvimarinus algae TaxID=3058037 RepID=A0ABT8THB2_9GAMM|nr:type I-F CRISPR-associated helicase Cas3f [Gilvimarinus sp. SDUM040014]MDO3383301.1 type I-F CRISPR-associated helicase Cas3f [Gilvimarinus sp. SDUM040014]